TPEQALSNFDGENILGTWTLTIIDNNNQDAGTLNAWSLLIDFTPVTGGSDEVRVPQSNSDIDDDGIPNSRDNCPYAANPSQEDGWGSAMGDACDTEWYNLSGIGVSAFPQKDGTFDVYGNCTFMADGDPRCPIIASFDPATFTPDMMPKEFTLGDAGTWSVWVYYLHSNNGADVYQVNTYTTNPPQPDTLTDDRMEIHVYGGSWQWYQRVGRSHGLPNGVGMVINSSGDAGSDSSSEKGG
ncbi:MAG: proprotein convertase P-domain-containing protein, partial [Anaerolineae bacterium]|nr:proprotein convertase P-domain-containing protein [Anaerolineae bacterium]